MVRTSGTNRWVVGTNLETSVVKKFKGRTVILSYWLRKGSSLTADTGVALKTTSAEARFNSSVDSSTATITAAQLSTSTFTRFTQTLTIPAGSTALGLAVEFEAKSQAGAANAFLDIAMVQLEVGTIATPFEQRPIGTELALCQRYYWRISGNATNTGKAIGFGNTGPGTTATAAFVNCPVTMRTVPTLIETSTMSIADQGAATAVTGSSIVAAQSSEQYVFISASTAGGLTSYRPYVYQLGGASAFFALGAEL
jgi:hypothetical protein